MTKSELESLIQSSGRDIFSFCEQLAGSRAEAEELYQDTFLQAVRKLNKIDAKNNPKSYLLSIAIRIWRNKKRKAAWRARIAPEEGLTEEAQDKSLAGTTPEGYVIRLQDVRTIREELKMLPEKYRLPLILYYMEELSVAQIAKIVKAPTGTVKSRLFKARELLKGRLLEKGVEF